MYEFTWASSLRMLSLACHAQRVLCPGCWNKHRSTQHTARQTDRLMRLEKQVSYVACVIIQREHWYHEKAARLCYYNFVMYLHVNDFTLTSADERKVIAVGIEKC